MFCCRLKSVFFGNIPKVIVAFEIQFYVLTLNAGEIVLISIVMDMTKRFVKVGFTFE